MKIIIYATHTFGTFSELTKNKIHAVRRSGNTHFVYSNSINFYAAISESDSSKKSLARGYLTSTTLM